MGLVGRRKVEGSRREAPVISSTHSVSVAGVVINGERQALLIQRRDNQHWEPPGGVLEQGEAILHGLRREVREETGLEVDSACLTGVYKNMSRGIVALVYVCTPIGGQLTTNDEVQAFHWASEEEITASMTEAFAIRILDALHYKGDVPTRAHDGTHLL